MAPTPHRRRWRDGVRPFLHVGVYVVAQAGPASLTRAGMRACTASRSRTKKAPPNPCAAPPLAPYSLRRPGANFLLFLPPAAAAAPLTCASRRLGRQDLQHWAGANTSFPTRVRMPSLCFCRRASRGSSSRRGGVRMTLRSPVLADGCRLAGARRYRRMRCNIPTRPILWAGASI